MEHKKYTEEYFHTKSKDELVTMLTEHLNSKKYGLVWEDTPELLDSKNIYPLLKEQKDLSLNKLTDKPMNYLIEGDNYHSLKALQKTHLGKINVIYIDPPYNTGNEFVYNDKIVDKEDNFRHSKWLSFMEKRLKLAKNLLSEDGVIFVSIDDNEQAQFKLLMDSILGENNFVATFIWEKGGGSSLSKTTRSVTEYIHVYSKNKENIELIHEVTKQQGDGSLYKEKNKVNTLTFKAGEVLFINNEEGLVKFEDFPKGYLSNSFTIKGGKNTNKFSITDKWTWTQEYLELQIEKGTKILSKNKNLRLRYMKNSEVRVRPRTLLPKNVGYTITGSTELRAMGIEGFDYPKPVGIIKYLISLITKETKNGIILDFFAGSGTTGHAVMELNKEDGGNRKFILCTNNEVSTEKECTYLFEQGLIPKNNKTEFNKYKKNNPEEYQEFLNSENYQELGIARSVTRERLKRVINGYTTPKGVEVEGLPNNLMYLKTDEIYKNSFNLGDNIPLAVKETLKLVYPSTTHKIHIVNILKDIENIEVEDNLENVYLIDSKDDETNSMLTNKIMKKFGKDTKVELVSKYL